jgi:hypothetical protein
MSGGVQGESIRGPWDLRHDPANAGDGAVREHGYPGTWCIVAKLSRCGDGWVAGPRGGEMKALTASYKLGRTTRRDMHRISATTVTDSNWRGAPPRLGLL